MIEVQATINTNDLIADLASLNERLIDIYDDAINTDDEEMTRLYDRSYQRLNAKRKDMLIQLRDAINDEIGKES